MSRFGKGYSYGHAIKRFAEDHYRLFWTVDFYYSSSNLRHPRGFSRDTDKAGAMRFAKKWKREMPHLPVTLARPPPPQRTLTLAALAVYRVAAQEPA